MQDRRTFNEILFSHFRGMTEDQIEVLSKEVFEDIIRPAIYSGAHDLIRQCKEGGFKVVIVTGSLDVTTRYVTQHLGADYFIANRLEFKDGYATGKMLHPLVAGPEKASKSSLKMHILMGTTSRSAMRTLIHFLTYRCCRLLDTHSVSIHPEN